MLVHEIVAVRKAATEQGTVRKIVELQAVNDVRPADPQGVRIQGTVQIEAPVEKLQEMFGEDFATSTRRYELEGIEFSQVDGEG